MKVSICSKRRLAIRPILANLLAKVAHSNKSSYCLATLKALSSASVLIIPLKKNKSSYWAKKKTVNKTLEELLTIGPEFEGFRIDQFLAHFFDQESRSYFQGLIEKNAVSVNGKTVKKRQLLKDGDCVFVRFEQSPEICLEPQEILLDILHEDEDLLVINKEAARVVHPGVGNPSMTIVNALLFHCRDLPCQEGDYRPGIVHRLDKDTSGVLVLAKTRRAQLEMSRLFAQREIQKEYLAIVHGHFQDQIVNKAIARDPQERKKMCLRDDGKEAITRFETLLTKDGYSLLKAFPKSGRTHQIRVHCQSLKASIIGDEVYGSKKIKDQFKCRQMLHAHKISFQDPFKKAPVQFIAPPPKDFLQTLEKLFAKEDLFKLGF